MTEVVSRARLAGSSPTRLSRVRCPSCAMPARDGTEDCWSCGLPTSPAHVEAPQVPEVAAGRSRRSTLLPGAGLFLVLVIVLGCLAVLGPPGGGRGPRGVAARLRGDAWPRASLSGASADFPDAPVLRRLPAGPGLPAGGEALAATSRGLRAELVVAPLDSFGTVAEAGARAEELIAGYAESAGARLVERPGPVPGGGPGVQALLDRAGDRIRVLVRVAGATAYLLAVEGAPGDFERFTSSFRLLS